MKWTTGMGWSPIVGSKSGTSWSSYWTAQNNFWAKTGTRSGITLPDTIDPGTGDANILLPYFYKPTGDEYIITC